MSDETLPKQVPRFEHNVENSIAHKVYQILEGIINANRAPTALVVFREVTRKPSPTASVIAGASLLAIWYFLAWYVALPAAGGILLWRMKRGITKTFEAAARSPFAFPDVPEFKNLWAVTCWRLVPLLHGFNVRVDAVNQLRNIGESAEATAIMETVLEAYRSSLEQAWKKLNNARPIGPYHSAWQASLEPNEPNSLIDAQVRKSDPLSQEGDDLGLDWLGHQTGPIPLDEFELVLARDVSYLQHAYGEVKNAVDPFAKLKKKVRGKSKRKAKTKDKPGEASGDSPAAVAGDAPGEVLGDVPVDVSEDAEPEGSA